MADQKPVYRYQLLRGAHTVGTGNNMKMYEPGDVFESEKDITDFMNPRGAEPRVRLLMAGTQPATEVNGGVGGTPVAPQELPPEASTKEVALEDLTIGQLKQLAFDQELDLEGLTRKADIIAALRAAHTS